MALTPIDVRRIAELARLDLGADEQALMLEQLNSFFRIVEQMSALAPEEQEELGRLCRKLGRRASGANGVSDASGTQTGPEAHANRP